uniref:Rab-GAP TBC domain-containing protein n=1 Tax=Entomoneis paludosa TaxID=265537 RepID=A0A7S3DQY5_9STRA|mmetsp:Transcript_28489/g.59469  ORF Transcript_28489/g.59469 Transcript_28489/m.59469 type:complete len:741 (+) Transcript_28489:261-2483(+)|eukprot:CAMPEP_0172458014 /NCGR_PEP_ID=MMETSP1065-20121228/25503_1 /TAXON_ID=265537 /ORGANISM="Amphiprora paludosa, Strain CCMP125" /LENGTH=740 /DNA_ID=CAMNT_0013212069 /DNA_START=193 /DNA_END=2415 /DNA_ORIENTATION=-
MMDSGENDAFVEEGMDLKGEGSGAGTTVTIVESGTDEAHQVSLSEEETNQLETMEKDHDTEPALEDESQDDNLVNDSLMASSTIDSKLSLTESPIERSAPSTPKSSPPSGGNENLANQQAPSLPSLSPTKQQQHQNSRESEQTLPMLSECLYGVPEDDEVWEGFFAQQPDDVVDEKTGHFQDAEIWKRQARVRGHAINLSQLRRLAALGIPDEGSHRGVVWRLLLGPYLPHDNIDKWQSTLAEKRSTYISFCQKFFMWNDWNFGHVLRVKRKQEQRGPMILRLDMDESYQSMTIQLDDEEEESANQSESSLGGSKIPTKPVPSEMFNNPNVLKELVPQVVQDAWTDRGKDLHILEALQKSFNALRLPSPDNPDEIREFVESATLLDEIRKDVVRTHSDLAFFLDPVNDLGRRRYAAIERILFLWVKFNETGVRYVQGMNEIVGTLYYVCANDSRTEWANSAELDSYWLLDALLDDMRDLFVPELDAVDTGIRGRISALQDLLERHDPALKEHFLEIGVDSTFYGVRWLSTFLAREFLLPDTIRLWDSMFASTHKDNFLRYVCVTMLFLIRDQLLQGDFVTCIRLLQRYPTVHMDHLLESSRSLYIYETQITMACHKANISQHVALLNIAPPPNLIMAFGLKRGIAPKATVSSSEIVQNAASSARNAFKSMFHRMRSWSSDTNSAQSNNNNNNASAPPKVAVETPSPMTPQRQSAEASLHEEIPESPDIYMKAILGDQSAS